MFYLKYRPQKVADLDLEIIRQKLAEILKAKNLPHAYLFAGPKGAGKTSAARILAKAVNCEKRLEIEGKKKLEASKDYEPCNRCSICKSITRGTALDLIEIDAASNRGIDDIRNLREKIKLTPSRARYKVYVIDEAHMLTREAFNALLKTLEEPPEHAIFVLCTTEPEKLPETIISRCLYLQFKKGKPAEVKRSLERVIKAEKIKIEPEALALMTRTAEGSFRDVQKILEQLAMEGRKITRPMVEKEIGRSGLAFTQDFLKLVLENDAKRAIEVLNQQVAAGLGLEEFTSLILEELRLVLLTVVGYEAEESGTKDFARTFSKEEMIDLISLFEEAARDLKTAVIPQLPLEMAVVKWSLKQSNPKRKNFSSEARTFLKNDFGDNDGSVKIEEIKKRWEEILGGVKPYNHSVEALLRSARPLAVDGKILTIEVFYSFHQERLNTEKNRSLIERVASKIIKKPIGLKCILGGKNA